MTEIPNLSQGETPGQILYKRTQSILDNFPSQRHAIPNIKAYLRPVSGLPTIVEIEDIPGMHYTAVGAVLQEKGTRDLIRLWRDTSINTDILIQLGKTDIIKLSEHGRGSLKKTQELARDLETEDIDKLTQKLDSFTKEGIQFKPLGRSD